MILLARRGVAPKYVGRGIMPKVYCSHHWIVSKKISRCSICDTKWNPAKDKKPPEIVIGILSDYAPVFSDSDSVVKDAGRLRTKGSPVYCDHAWEHFGHQTNRCVRCRTIWKKFEIHEEPLVIIGFCQI